MNESQKLLMQIASDPNRAIRFLNNLTLIMGSDQRNKSRIVIGYLMGMLSAIIGYTIANLLLGL